MSTQNTSPAPDATPDNDTGDIDRLVESMGKRARDAARKLAAATPAAKIDALLRLADLLEGRETDILAANARDLDAARAVGMDPPRMDRLRLTPRLVAEMAAACRHVAHLPDPVGTVETQWQRPNGLLVGRMRIPLGVIAIVYESRPNVTVDSAILCLKAGNAVILRGGSEAIHSNMALDGLIAEAMAAAGLPGDAVQVVASTDRAAVRALCAQEQYIDVIIPRGGEALIRTVVQQAAMPVLKHFRGVCHAYVDTGADLEQAVEVIFNSKVQRPGVCNALECLLVHRDVAAALLPAVADRLSAAGVIFRACPASLPLLGEWATAAAPEDYGMEFHDLILAVRMVEGLDEALAHIATYGTNHTEIICTRDHGHAMRFLREADASMVAVNASSRLNDGGQLGLGAEIGISTSKLHAYGPMGVQELTTTKFVVIGTGQIRE